VANKIGDLCFAVYSRNNLNTNLLAAGDPLVRIQREAENGREFAQKAGFGFMIDAIAAQLGLIRTLRGLTTKFGSFDDGQFDELRFERHLESDPVPAQPVCFYWIRKLQAGFFAADYVSALDAALKAEPLLWTAPSNLELAEYHLYGALCRAALWDSASPDQRRQHFKALTAHEKQLQIWAENCPENFENRAALVGAEIARIEGRVLDAEDLYELAIRSARANGFVHNEALVNELSARFYAARGFEKIADAYRRDARYGYLRWGATGKVRQLDELYPQLQEKELAAGPTSTIGTPVEQLDFATVIKVSQAVSGEMVFEKLIDTLMRTAIEHAGAERGLLLLQRGDEQRIEAEATVSGDSIIVCQKEAAASTVPESIVHYVERTGESVILDDAAAQNPFSADTYIRERHARSILCLPLIHQGKLSGVLYLENNLTPHVFTPTRIAVLKFLASQAAISLENTRLYADLEERETKIRRLVDANIIGIIIAKLEGEIVDANQAFLRMVGYSHEDLVSGRIVWTDLTPPEWRDTEAKAAAELKANGILKPIEREFFRKDGSRVAVLAGSALFEKGGNEVVAFIMDITDQKRAEEERERLRRAQADLAHLNRVSTMGELTASLAHEIKQPMFAASADAETCLRWLARDQPDVAEAQEAALRLMKDVNRASDIINRIVMLFKKDVPQRELVDVNGVIQEMIALLRNEASQYSISINAQLTEGLPNIMADRVALQQVLMNLMLNAIEAMKEKGTPGKLTITTRQDENRQLLVSVTDTGVGLPPGPAEQIFDAFFTSKPQGTGMGLRISRSIIESHGGRLWATSNSGPGATFEFALPLETAARQSA
jgi:PAS domain S-box-containing protein